MTIEDVSEPRTGEKARCSGHDRLKCLNIARGAVWGKVSHSMTNGESDHIFDTDGFFI